MSIDLGYVEGTDGSSDSGQKAENEAVADVVTDHAALVDTDATSNSGEQGSKLS